MQTIHPVSEFWIETKLDQEMMDYLWSQIKMARETEKELEDKLVGHITSSLTLPDTEGKLNDCVLENAKHLNYIYHPQFKIRELWVNFQKKYDFQPLHSHNGALSFVIWMKIPYTYEEEAKTTQTQSLSDGHLSGCFQMLYTSLLGTTKHFNYFLNPEYEGTMIVFPASYQHQVHPFYTSDEERISISGNIF